MATSEPSSGGTHVYAAPFGSAYHAEPCPFLKRYNARQQQAHRRLPLAEAKSKGLRPCPWCEGKGLVR